MQPVTLLTFDSSRALVERAVSDWRALLARIPPDQPYAVALSGGRLSAAFFSALTRAELPALRQIHFFWADERCVPPAHPESNYRVAAEHLFEPLGIPTAHIHRIRGEAPPGAAAAEAERDLRTFTGAAESSCPQLDLVFLGMGEDGLVASLFPSPDCEGGAGVGPATTAPNPDLRVYISVTAPKPPPQRISLTYQALASARQVWVLVSGPGKEAALQDSLNPASRTPLRQVIGLRTHTRILTDTPLRA